MYLKWPLRILHGKSHQRWPHWHKIPACSAKKLMQCQKAGFTLLALHVPIGAACAILLNFLALHVDFLALHVPIGVPLSHAVPLIGAAGRQGHGPHVLPKTAHKGPRSSPGPPTEAQGSPRTGRRVPDYTTSVNHSTNKLKNYFEATCRPST